MKCQVFLKGDKVLRCDIATAACTCNAGVSQSVLTGLIKRGKAVVYCLFMSDKLFMLSHHVLGPCKDCVDRVWLTQC